MEFHSGQQPYRSRGARLRYLSEVAFRHTAAPSADTSGTNFLAPDRASMVFGWAPACHRKASQRIHSAAFAIPNEIARHIVLRSANSTSHASDIGVPLKIFMSGRRHGFRRHVLRMDRGTAALGRPRVLRPGA